MRNLVSLSIGLLTVALVAGCGGPAVSAGVPIKAGQFFRFLNATDENLELRFDGLPVQNPHTFAGSYCSFRKGSPKEHSFEVFRNGQSIHQEKVRFVGDAFVTYVVLKEAGKIRIVPIDSEKRKLLPTGSEVRLLAAGLPSSTSVSLVKGSKKIDLGTVQGVSGTPAGISAEPGMYDVVTADGKKIGEAELEPKIVYSLGVFRSSGGLKATLMRNSPSEMQQAGAAVQSNQ